MAHDIWAIIAGAMESWHQGKLFLENALSLSHDSIHLFGGVLVWLVAALLVRRPISSWRPWLWLMAAVALNEAVDLWTEQWPDPGQQYGEGVKDLLLTMAVPTLLMLAARFRPDLFRTTARRKTR